MKVVLIGAGRIGALHAQSLRSHPAVGELLIADLDLARARELAQRHDAFALTPDAAFESAPDAVVVAVATPAHPPLVRRCIEAEIPCFCEKPLAAGVEETVELVRLSERRPSLVQVGFMRRFDQAIAELRRLVTTGELGRIDAVRVASHDHEPPSEEYAAGSGGIFRDQLIHDFDMIRWVADSELSWIYAAGAIRALRFLERYGDVDTTVISFGLSSGPLGVLTGTREDGRGEDVRIEMIGSSDSASAGLNARTPLRLCDPVGVSTELAPYGDARDRFADAYAAELAHFLRAANGEGASACDARDALGTLLVAEAAERSLAANAPVSVRHAADLLDA
jgi:myo-inositol 2-dehydrogenase / D-chiro-inositol 1-dehydrogenase